MLRKRRYIFFAVLIFFLSQVSFYVCSAAPGDSTASSASGTKDLIPPTVPKELIVSNKTFTSIQLSWTASTDNIAVRGYELYRNGKKIVVTKKTNYTNINLLPGKEYVYSVKAYDAAGNISESCNPISVFTIEDFQVPSIPGNLQAVSVDYTTVTLSWKPSADNVGVKGYEIYCNGKKAAATSATGYTCRKLAPGVTYTFTVKACDAAGNCSFESDKCTVCTVPDVVPPSRPGELKITAVTETKITLSWPASPDNVKVKEYEVFCNGKSMARPKSTAITANNLIPGAEYSFTVRAVDTSGNVSVNSSQLKVTTLKDQQQPGAPTNLKASSSTKSSVSFKWTASEDNVKVAGYFIYCFGIKVATTSRTSYTLKGLGSLNAALIWVKAYDVAGNVSEKSNSIVLF